MGTGYIPAARQAKIAQLVKEKGLVTVDELSQTLSVSVITIRRDLDYLESQGVLERTHGGAISTQHMKGEALYTQKNQVNTDIKDALGKLAADQVEEGDTLFINSGSTTFHVLKNLRGRSNIRVFTNNAAAVVELGQGCDFELVLIGGAYRAQSGCIVGEFASATLNQVYASKCILGVDGFSIRSGLTSPIYQEAGITRLMMERTQGETIITADHSKVGRVSNFVISPIDKINTLVTDSRFEESFRQDLEKAGIKIMIADSAAE